jgi:hypothetical protein
MAVTTAFTIPQNNIAELTLPVTLPQVANYPPEPYPLTGLTLEFVIKPSASSDDGAGTTYTPTITDADQGLATLTIPGSQNASPGTFWYRLDVVDGAGNHVTALQGNWVVTAA